MLISKQNRRIIYENLFKGSPFCPIYPPLCEAFRG